MTSSRLLRGVSVLACLIFLAGCQGETGGSSRHMAPIPAKTVALMESKGTAPAEPMVVRLFKQEGLLEVWKRRSTDKKFVLLKTYPICAWSGQLGPKQREGDRQAPEGFYTITPGLMNPNSNYHLAFNLGYPNAFDRAHGRTGSHLMVHGACSSRGCYAMEDEQISEIYAMGRESFKGGQRNFQVQAYPFRMTPKNLARYRNNQHMPFWKNLKEGYDSFEITKAEPVVSVCNKKYVFNATSADGSPLNPAAPCPQLKTDPAFATALAAKQSKDEAEVRTLVAEGIAPVNDITEQERKTLMAQKRYRPMVDPAASEADVQIASAPAATPVAVQPRTAEPATPSATVSTATATSREVTTTASLAPKTQPKAQSSSGGAFGWLRGIPARTEDETVAISQSAPETSPKTSLSASSAPQYVPMPVPAPSAYMSPQASHKPTVITAPGQAVSPSESQATTAEVTEENAKPKRSPISSVFSVFQ